MIICDRCFKEVKEYLTGRHANGIYFLYVERKPTLCQDCRRGLTEAQKNYVEPINNLFIRKKKNKTI